MRFLLTRLTASPRGTLGALYALGATPAEVRFLCFTFEDPTRLSKIPKETAIPSGTYPLTLRLHGGHHGRYRRRYGQWHRGMVELGKVQKYTNILIHIGNDADDTEGCLLVGMQPQWRSAEGKYQGVGHSRLAYEAVYPALADAIETGPSTLEIVELAAALPEVAMA